MTEVKNTVLWSEAFLMFSWCWLQSHKPLWQKMKVVAMLIWTKGTRSLSLPDWSLLFPIIVLELLGYQVYSKVKNKYFLCLWHLGKSIFSSLLGALQWPMSILWSLSDTAETELKVQTCMFCRNCKMFFQLCMINIAFASFQRKNICYALIWKVSLFLLKCQVKSTHLNISFQEYWHVDLRRRECISKISWGRGWRRKPELSILILSTKMRSPERQ